MIIYSRAKLFFKRTYAEPQRSKPSAGPVQTPNTEKLPSWFLICS